MEAAILELIFDTVAQYLAGLGAAVLFLGLIAFIWEDF